MSLWTDRQHVFLQEMGLGPAWQSRDGEAPVADSAAMPSHMTEPAVEKMADPATEPSITRAVPSQQAAVAGVPADETLPAGKAVAEMQWGELKAEVAACLKCGLCKKRNNTVFGVGDEKAKWLFIGEGPGCNEDARGEPFVGPAGKLLDNMLLALGLRRGDNAYIANIVKCRPTDPNGKDRPPTAEEAAACMPYLLRQIALIEPTVIVALGKTAALSLLGLDPDTPVSSLRGKLHRYADRPLIVTYHPAYLLRSPNDKRKTWADLCLAMKTYSRA